MQERANRKVIFAVFLAGTVMSAPLALATENEAEAQFFKGKTVNFMVGAAPAGAADIMGRIVARTLQDHIPGQPNVVVQNMPGASSVNMFNQLYNRAPRDGTAMGLPVSGILLEQKLHTMPASAIKFDLNQMEWVGNPSNQPAVMWLWHDAPVKSFEGLVKGPEVIFGATSPGGDGYSVPLLMNRMMKTNLKLVIGYKAQQDIFVAAERGEVQGCVSPLYTVTVGRRDDYQSGRIRIVAQFGLERLPQLSDIPTGIELAQDEESKTLLKLWATKFEAAYPIGLPPGVPKARVAALREAFDRAMADPEFLRIAAKTGVEIAPMNGADLQKMVSYILSTDDSYFQKLRDFITP